MNRPSASRTIASAPLVRSHRAIAGGFTTIGEAAPGSCRVMAFSLSQPTHVLPVAGSIVANSLSREVWWKVASGATRSMCIGLVTAPGGEKRRKKPPSLIASNCPPGRDSRAE